jgi:hypothetical protein
MYEPNDGNSALDGYARVPMLLFELICDLLVYWV